MYLSLVSFDRLKEGLDGIVLSGQLLVEVFAHCGELIVEILAHRVEMGQDRGHLCMLLVRDQGVDAVFNCWVSAGRNKGRIGIGAISCDSV